MYIEYQADGLEIGLNIPSGKFESSAFKECLDSIELLNNFSVGRLEFSVSPTNVKEAEWMLYAFSLLSNAGENIPPWLLKYFSEIFLEILNGELPKKALGLIRAPHRPKQARVGTRNLEIYADVAKLMSEGSSLMTAAIDAGLKYHLDDIHIQKIYSSVKKNVEADKKLTIEIINGNYF